MKRGKKALAVLSTAALFGTTPAAVALPLLSATVVHAASAAATITALSVPTRGDTVPSASVGTIKIVVPAGGLKPGDSVSFRLPSGVSLYNPNNLQNGGLTTSDTLSQAPANQIVVPDKNGTDYNGALPNDFSITELDPNKEYKITFTGNTDPTNHVALSHDVVIFIQLGQVHFDGASDGPVNVAFSAPSDSGFPQGTVTVANVNSSGSVSLATIGTDTSNNTFDFDLRLQENTSTALRSGNLKLKLPSGYKWDVPSNPNKGTGYNSDGSLNQSKDIKVIYGDVPMLAGSNVTTAFTITVDGDQLTISYDGSAHNSASLIDIPLSFHIDDESLVKPGDINATVTGTLSADQSQIPVGTYGEYSSSVSVSKTVDLTAGKAEQLLGDIVITESLQGSLVQGRTVTFTLPDGLIWQPVYDANIYNQDPNYTTKQDPNNTPPGSVNGTKSLQLTFSGYTGTDMRTAKFTVTHASNDSGATVKIQNAQVAVRPDFSGDVNLEVGGTAGLTGTVKLGAVTGGVKVTDAQPADVKIGVSGQATGDITITETAAGVFSHKAGSNTVTLELPGGVAFAGTPTVQVTDGDLRITNVRTANKGNLLQFDIDSESSQPSTITLSNVNLDVDRSVAAGPIVLKVKGGETAKYSSWQDNILLGQATIANVVTPAPGQVGATATFTVGSTTYTVNGQQQTMDVAPYLKNDGRVMLPVRFVANALGVNDNNIIWNGADKSVTIFKNNTVVKMTVGSSTMIVNGVAVPMDVAPELYNDGRVMLPIRWIGQALGAQLTWDQATQTVTVTAQ